MQETPIESTDTLVVECHVRAKPSDVFSDLTVPDRLLRWWGEPSSLARNRSEPGVIVKVGRVNHQRVALPVADGVAEVGGVYVGAMWPTVGGY
jgi:uncharacterized protein YndB with AHSA1/START domain